MVHKYTMAINGKQKGNRFEREVSNTLSSRFAAHTGITTSFYRNASSGSFFGGSNKIRKETHNTEFAVYGDITCPRNFLYSIECKNYKEPPSFDSVLAGDIRQWDEWITQSKQDATESGKKMLLIIKYNRTKVFCIIEPSADFIPSFIYKGLHVIMLDTFLGKNDHFYFSP